MPIYEPTQIVPSTFTNSETIAVNNQAEVQWQINGNSALTAFQIDFYVNNAESTFLFSTNRISSGYGMPFNGTNRYGRQEYFTYAPENTTWTTLSSSLMTDGNDYKYKITQWFAAVVQVASVSAARSYSANTTYYFYVTNQSSYVAFTPTSSNNSIMQNATFYYDFTNEKGWFVTAENRLVPLTMYVTSTQPSGTRISSATINSAQSNEDWIQQISESAIITRSEPTLSLSITQGESEAQENTLVSSVATFQGAYLQAQGVSVRSVRWVLENNQAEILEDTGAIYTSVLEYSYNGFFNGGDYTLLCSVETETGVQVEASLNFSCDYDENTYYGEFTAECIPSEGSVLLSWEPLLVITATADGDYTINDGSITLDIGTTITWDTELDEPMNFLAPWTAIWEGRLQTSRTDYEDSDTIEVSGTTGTEGTGEQGLTTTQDVGGNADEYIGNVTQEPTYPVISGTTSGGSSTSTVTRNPSGTSVAYRRDSSDSFAFNGTASPHSTGSKTLNRTASGTTGIYEDINLGYVAAQKFTVDGVITNATAIPDGNTTYASCEINGSTVTVRMYSNEPRSPVSASVTIEYDGYEYYQTFSKTISENGVSISDVNVTSSSGSRYETSISGSTYSVTVYASKEGAPVSATGSASYTYIAYYHASGSGVLGYNISSYSITSKSPNVIGAICEIDGNEYTWDATTQSAGESVSLTIVFYVTIPGTPSYRTTKNYPGITSASIVEVVSGTNAGVSVNQSAGTYTVTIYGSYSGQSVSARVQVNSSLAKYRYQETFPFSLGKITGARLTENSGVDGSVSYSLDGKSYMVTLDRYGAGNVTGEVEIEYDSTVYTTEITKAFTAGTITGAEITATENVNATVTYTDSSYTVTLISSEPSVSGSATAKLDYSYSKYGYTPQGTIFTLQGGNITISRSGKDIIVGVGTNEATATLTPQNDSVSATIAITPTAVYAYFFNSAGQATEQSATLSYTQEAVTSVSIQSGTSASTVYGVSVVQGDGTTILPFLQTQGFEPSWSATQYSLYLNANFNGNIEGGTGSASSGGCRIYREEVGTNILFPIYMASSLETQVKDFSIVSGKQYNYYLYVYDSTNAFMGQKGLERSISIPLSRYTLAVTEYDEERNLYHVLREYVFLANASIGVVSNNNNPTIHENFTGYPTRMKSVQNYASGTLTSLIGAIYQSQYGITSGKIRTTYEYSDSVELEQELNEISTSDYTLFLRDPKGHIYMVQTQSAITQTVDYGKKPMPISISLPWVEIDSASDASVIQAEGDAGWNNGRDIFDVSLNVNVETGVLSAEYPVPYNSTKFSVRGNQLYAKTPSNITPAEFTLSEVAQQPDDGELNASMDGTDTQAEAAEAEEQS